MLLSKSSGLYLKADASIRGKTIRFMDEGIIETSDKFTNEDGTPKKSLIFSVSLAGETKKLRVNRTAERAMIDAYGYETKNWIGKEARIIIMPTQNGEHKMIVLEPTDVTAWDEK